MDYRVDELGQLRDHLGMLGGELVERGNNAERECLESGKVLKGVENRILRSRQMGPKRVVSNQ